MGYIKVYGETAIISRFVDLSARTSANIIRQTAISGRDYLTAFGDATERYTVQTWVRAAGKAALETAYSHLSLLEISTSAGVKYGRAAALDFEDLPAHWYKATLDLSSEVIT